MKLTPALIAATLSLSISSLAFAAPASPSTTTTQHNETTALTHEAPATPAPVVKAAPARDVTPKAARASTTTPTTSKAPTTRAARERDSSGRFVSTRTTTTRATKSDASTRTARAQQDAEPAISREDANKNAMAYIKERFQTDWKDVTKNLKTEITPTDNQFTSDPTHPITGRGQLVSMVVKEDATQKSGWWQKLSFGALGFMNRYKERRFDVYVGADGKAQQLDTVHLDRWSRLKEWAKPFGAMPTTQFDKTMKDLGEAALGVVGGNAVGGPWLAAGLVVLKARDFYKSAQTLNTDRQNMMVNETATWARAEIKAGRTPSLSDAYLHYSDELNHDDVGHHLAPMNAYDFSRLLKASGL